MNIEEAKKYFITSLSYAQLSKHTITAYTQDLNQWINSLTKTELQDLNFMDFEAYFAYLQSLDLKVSSLKRKRLVIHRFLKYCYDKKLCEERLFEFITPIKYKKQHVPKEVLEPQEITLLFKHFVKEINLHKEKENRNDHANQIYYCSIRNYLVISILLYTGCRANEAVSLSKKDINLNKKSLVLFTKGGKYNEIPTHDKLVEAFQFYYEEMEYLKGTEIYNLVQKSKFIFPSIKNPTDHIAPRTLHDVMKKIGKILNRPIHAHLFRHTFASYCIANQMDITTLSSLISHSNPAITLSIYTHEISANQKRSEIKKLQFDFD